MEQAGSTCCMIAGTSASRPCTAGTVHGLIMADDEAPKRADTKSEDRMKRFILWMWVV